MLPTDEWLPEARKLEVGQRKRLSHRCGPGTPLLISRDARGFTAHCFRCNDSGHRRDHAGVSDRIARLTLTAERQAAGSATLPTNDGGHYTTWPRPYLTWLLKAGLNYGEIESYGIYYSASLRRVVIPVMQSGRVTMWVARALEADRPKYLYPSSVDRSRVVYPVDDCKTSTLVLVEDALSAIRVGRAFTTWSLLGTNLSTPVMGSILQRHTNNRGQVAVWMDPDFDKPGRPGRVAARKIVRQLRFMGIRCADIVSPADPKNLDDAVITGLIQEATYA